MDRWKYFFSSNTLDETRVRTELQMSRISELESVNLSLQQKLSDMIQALDDETFSHRAQVQPIITIAKSLFVFL